MITNLPLIFVKGQPKALGDMTVDDLECFIPFLVQCSLGHDTTRNILKPAWWPSSVPYAESLRKPKPHSPVKWASDLRDVVRLCYRHHDSEFLLDFCDKLAKNPPSALLYEDNCDTTTSLYLKSNRRLLVTFRNENILYDREPIHHANRKSLLPHRAKASTVQAETISIYLCDTCDESFDDLKALQSHEKTCSASSAPSQEEEEDIPGEEIVGVEDKAGFLRSLRLFDVASGPSGSSPVKAERLSPVKRDVGPRRTKAVYNDLFNFPFSSPAGLLVNRNRRRSEEGIEQQRELTERYCSTPLGQLHGMRNWRRNFKNFPTKYKKPEDYWTRFQVFPSQRRKMFLDIESQLNLFKCKPCSVILKNMSEKDIENCKAKLRTEVESVSNVNKLENCSEIQTNFVEIFIPLDVIDLCSDDEDHDENVHPLLRNSRDIRPPGDIVGINPKLIRQCPKNLFSSHMNNVISIDKDESM